MALFGNHDDVTLAMKVGELLARTVSLEAQVAALQAVRPLPVPPESVHAIPPKVVFAIKGLAGKDAALARHLTDEAAGLIGMAGMDAERVIEVLVTGTRH